MAAISTDQQTGKYIFLTFICPALSDFAALLLNLLPCNPVDYRLMHIFEHYHVFRIIIKSLFVFVGFGISFEINQISTIVGTLCLLSLRNM